MKRLLNSQGPGLNSVKKMDTVYILSSYGFLVKPYKFVRSTGKLSPSHPMAGQYVHFDTVPARDWEYNLLDPATLISLQPSGSKCRTI